MSKKSCNHPDQKLVYCVNAHASAETKRELRKRVKKVEKALRRWRKKGKLPMAHPEGAIVWPNHGSGGGP